MSPDTTPLDPRSDFPWRAYAIQRPDGSFTGWRLDAVAHTTHYQARARRVGGILFESIQWFPAIPGAVTGLSWRGRDGRPGGRDLFSGKNARATWTPLFFDIDVADDLNAAMRLARAVAVKFTAELASPAGDVEVFFSGAKGFHIVVNPLALGIVPAVDATATIMKAVALALNAEVAEGGASGVGIDPAAYSFPRLLRVTGRASPQVRPAQDPADPRGIVFP